MKTADVLKEARAKIETGWCRTRMEQWRGGRMCYCAVGAVDASTTLTEERFQAYRELQRTIAPAALGSYTPIIFRFNDESPSKKRVLAVFDETIARLEGGS